MNFHLRFILNPETKTEHHLKVFYIQYRCNILYFLPAKCRFSQVTGVANLLSDVLEHILPSLMKTVFVVVLQQTVQFACEKDGDFY